MPHDNVEEEDQMTEEPIAPRARRGRGRNGDAEDDSAMWAQRKGRRKRDGRGKGADGLLHTQSF